MPVIQSFAERIEFYKTKNIDVIIKIIMYYIGISFRDCLYNILELKIFKNLKKIDK